MNESIQIMSIEAKDLVFDNYEITPNKKYKATLDYSLESIMLEIVHKNVFRNNNFIFKVEGRQRTNDIINVTFEYSVKNELGKVLMSTELLRNKLYKDGFLCNGKRYVRFKRSSGSSRVGKCLFIREEMYNKIMKWSLMGLDYKDGDKVDLASLEAYIALTTSSIIDTIEIKPENILLINDHESVFKDRVMVTRINKDNELETFEDYTEVKNNIWDGETIADESIFIKNGYADKGMLLLRNRMFKSCCFNGKVQKFFKDNGITDVKQLNGVTMAKSIDEVLLITTPSSIKYLKFGTFSDYLKELDTKFGVVKYDKPTHYFDGELVQTHYQLLNTLEMSKQDVQEFLKDSIEYLDKLKNDLPTLRYHLKMKNEDEVRIKGISTTNDFIFSMLQVNDKIKNTKMFSDFVKDTCKSFVRNLRQGHIYVSGNYSTLFGNGLEMLYSSIGKFDGESFLGKDEAISMRFEEGKDILGVRSPHVTIGNLWVFKNVRHDEYLKYFNLTKQILCVNAIGCNILERLNGADYDSDSILITDNELLLKKAKENYKDFLVPTSKVVSRKVQRFYTSEQKSDLDRKTSVNKIGEIINFSQILNSYLWEIKKSGGDYSDVYKDICQLAVMSCIEIDSAKKEFDTDNSYELKKLRTKYEGIIDKKPMFFTFLNIKQDDMPRKLSSEERKEILEDRKTKKIEELAKHRNYETTMDYLEEIITKECKKIRMKRKQLIDIKDLLIDSTSDIKVYKANYKQAKKIVKMCEESKIRSASIWTDTELNSSQKYILHMEEKANLVKNISKLDVSVETIKKILCEVEPKNQRKILSTLYDSHRSVVEKLLKDGKTEIELLNKNENGDIILYKIRYKIFAKKG